MLTQEQLLVCLSERHAYNYRELLENEAISADTSNEASARILNTLEIFAFGDCKAFDTHQAACVTLNEATRKRLVELSLLSVLNRNVGNYVNYRVLLEAVGPEIRNAAELEAVLITMVDEKVVGVTLDDINERVRVINTPVLRDAFNEHTYQLRVLRPCDVESISVTQARVDLKKWLDEKITPTRAELET